MRVLAVVAHPDDESFFAGGTLALHAANGDGVKIVALTDGVSSRGDDTGAAIARRCYFAAACRTLGAEYELWQLFPDQQADAVSQLSINKEVHSLVCRYDPDLVYTHHVGDLNLDHRRVAEAVLVATRQGATVRCITPEWPERCVGPKFQPEQHVSFGTAQIEAKVLACLCYVDELRPYPHPRSERAIREKTQSQESFMEIR